MRKKEPSSVGLLNERSLHAALKALYLVPGALTEVKIGRSIADILVPPDRVIEIQTSSFAKIRQKIERLLPDYKVTIVHPIAEKKHILVYDKKGNKILSKRKSPKKACLCDTAFELSQLRSLIGHPHLAIEVVFIEEEEIRTKDGKGSWRRRGVSISDRKLVRVNETVRFAHLRDYLKFLPPDCPALFTNKELARLVRISTDRARQVTFLLRSIGLLEVKDKKDRAYVYGPIPAFHGHGLLHRASRIVS